MIQISVPLSECERLLQHLAYRGNDDHLDGRGDEFRGYQLGDHC